MKHVYSYVLEQRGRNYVEAPDDAVFIDATLSKGKRVVHVLATPDRPAIAFELFVAWTNLDDVPDNAMFIRTIAEPQGVGLSHVFLCAGGAAIPERTNGAVGDHAVFLELERTWALFPGVRERLQADMQALLRKNQNPPPLGDGDGSFSADVWAAAYARLRARY